MAAKTRTLLCDPEDPEAQNPTTPGLSVHGELDKRLAALLQVRLARFEDHGDWALLGKRRGVNSNYAAKSAGYVKIAQKKR